MESKNYKYCVHCGKKIPFTAKKCRYCHEWLNSNNISSNSNYAYMSNEDSLKTGDNLDSNMDSNNHLTNKSNCSVDSNAGLTNGDVDSDVGVTNGDVDSSTGVTKGLNDGDNLSNGIKRFDDSAINTSSFYSNNMNIKKFSNKIIPIRRLFLLVLFTGKLYFIYWFYNNAKLLKEHFNEDISVELRTIGLLIPIVNWFVFYDLLSDYEYIIEERGLDSYSTSWNFLIYFFVPFLGIWSLINIQESINELWKLEEPELAISRKFTNNEIFVLVIFGLLWICIILFFMMMWFVALTRTI